MAQRPKKTESTGQLLRYITRWDYRLRLTQMTVWVPRGLAAGLLIGLLIALYSRMQPWLFPIQVFAITGLAMLMGAMTALIGVWLWPRPALKAARYFDRVFGLRERSSTALEIAAGSIQAAPMFVELQGQDTLIHAEKVRARHYLRFQWRRYELAIILALVVFLVLALLSVNPQSEVLAQQNAVQEALANQIEQLQEVKRQIESNTGLSEDEKKQLAKIVDEAITKLQQPNVTQPEAVAELSRASQLLEQSKTKLNELQRSAAKQAADALDQSQTTQAAGQSLQTGDLNEAAKQLQNLSQKINDGQLTQQQTNETEQALRAAAQALEGTNPKAAEALRRAADALKKGDKEAAAKALKEAAEALRDQQNEMDQSPLSQAAKQAAQQLAQGRNNLAQAGQPNPKANANTNTSPSDKSSQEPNQDQSGQPSGEVQPADTQPDKVNGQPGQEGNQPAQTDKQPGQQPSDQSGQPDNGKGAPSESESGGQAGVPANPGESGKNSPGGNTESNKAGNPGGQPGNSGQPDNKRAAVDPEGNIPGGSKGDNGSGVGSGDSGSDVTKGDPNSTSGIEPTNKSRDANLANNQYIYAPEFAASGGNGPKLGLQTDKPSSENAPVQPGDQGNNPTGESKVELGQVLGQAAKQADEAMDSDSIPGALRGVVREYFTGLQQ
jgi:hypothetical protein